MMNSRFYSGWSRLRRTSSALAAAAVSLWLTVGPVLAQEATVRKIEESKPAWEWTMVVVFIAGCLVVAFKNSKRSNIQ